MTALVQHLVGKYYRADRGELLVGGVSVGSLAKSYGTPAFVYDRSTIDKKLEELLSALPPRFFVCYSVKANPNPLVVRHLVSRGCGLEIASAGEFSIALEAGCQPAKIVFAGPGKLESELEYVLSHGIGEIHLESAMEAMRTSSIARRLGIKARVAIRVNPAGEAEGGAMRMGGRATPFGVDEEKLDDLLDIVSHEDVLHLQGIHIFCGTQILDASIIVSQYRHGLEIARKVRQRTGLPLATLDFGGGLGIPYFSQDKELDLEALRAGLANLFETIDGGTDFQATRFIVEPGRFLVGEAGIYLARVNDIKISRGKKFLVLDGGMNHHLAASGNLGQTIKRNYPVALVNKLDCPPEDTVDVVGPLCTPLDTVARGVILPRAEIGDLFGIFQSGAYGRSASPLGFLSHPAPPEIWTDSGRAVPACPRTEEDRTCTETRLAEHLPSKM